MWQSGRGRWISCFATGNHHRQQWVGRVDWPANAAYFFNLEARAASFYGECQIFRARVVSLVPAPYREYRVGDDGVRFALTFGFLSIWASLCGWYTPWGSGIFLRFALELGSYETWRLVLALFMAGSGRLSWSCTSTRLYNDTSIYSQAVLVS